MTHSEHKTTLDFIVGEFCYRTAVDHNNIPGLWEECARVESAATSDPRAGGTGSGSSSYA